MKILRVVTDYWPCTGGNERWSLIHDRWFSEVARDEVQVVVLRPELFFQREGYMESLQGFDFTGDFVVPSLPKVKARQEIFPSATRLNLVRAYYKILRPWITKDFDLVITQVSHPHSYPCWGGPPVIYEICEPLLCPYDAYLSCQRNLVFCQKCFRNGGLRWWIQDQLQMALYRRFDLLVGTELMMSNLKNVKLVSKAHALRHIVNAELMRQPLITPEQLQQKAIVDELASRCEYVLMQFNRLVNFKNPQLLLDIAEQLPECGIVFAGDGAERLALEERTRTSPSLRDRVAFLGAVPASFLGLIAERISAFVMTSTISNSNTSLVETMGLGIGPVIAVDTHDFPAKFSEAECILKVSYDAVRSAAEIKTLLSDRERRGAMVANAKSYVETYHSPNQMWDYRNRLLQLVEQSSRHRGSVHAS